MLSILQGFFKADGQFFCLSLSTLKSDRRFLLFGYIFLGTSSHIFDASYLSENHNIMSIERARDIIEVFCEIFEDIDIVNDKLFDRSLNQYLDVSNAVVNFSLRDGDGEMYCFQNYFDSGSSSEQEEEIPCEDD